MGRVAVLQPDARVSAQVADALSGTHQVLICNGWTEVAERLHTSGLDAIVADADFPGPEEAIAQLRALRRNSRVGLVVWTEDGSAERFFDLGGAGVDALLKLRARPSVLRDQVARAIAEARGRWVRDLLPKGWLPEAAAALQWAVAHADEAPDVEALAGSVGLRPSTLRDLLKEPRLPSPNQLLLWGRLILAGARLEDPERTVESVAYSLGYATSAALSRAMKKHAGMMPSQVHEMGGMTVVLEGLIRHHRNDRRAGRTLRSPAVLLGYAGFALVLASLGGCATGGVDRGAIGRILDSPPMDRLHAGVLAIDAVSGDTLYSHNAHRRFVPASNQKVLVTAAALSLLGPDFRFRTELRTNASVIDGVLEGDLWVIPSGDPSLSGRYWPSGAAALESLARGVADAGIQRINGSVILDASAWDSTTVGPTWEFEDLRYTYGATGSILAIDEGELEVVVAGTPTPSGTAKVEWSAGGPDFVRARVHTVAADSTRRIRASYLPESRVIALEGHVPAGAVDTMRIAQRDPLGVALTELSNAFARTGIEVGKEWHTLWEPREAGECPQTSGPMYSRVIADLESPPLSQLVADILGPSQNWMTEQLLRALGSRFGEEGSWSEGNAVVADVLINEFGVTEGDVSVRDGSGLSAYNLVTPRAVVRILQAMATGPHADDFRRAMAEPGEEGSTLERRLDDLQDRVFAKTGTISNVNSLSGYLVGTDGREVIFSILTNGSGLPASRVRPIVDEIVRQLAR